jgi:hypothetical protein
MLSLHHWLLTLLRKYIPVIKPFTLTYGIAGSEFLMFTGPCQGPSYSPPLGSGGFPIPGSLWAMPVRGLSTRARRLVIGNLPSGPLWVTLNTRTRGHTTGAGCDGRTSGVTRRPARATAWLVRARFGGVYRYHPARENALQAHHERAWSALRSGNAKRLILEPSQRSWQRSGPGCP